MKNLKSSDVVLIEDILDESLDDLRYDVHENVLDKQIIIYIYFNLKNPPKINIFDVYFECVDKLLKSSEENSKEIWEHYLHKLHQVDFLQRIYRLTQFKLTYITDHQQNMSQCLKLTFFKKE